MISRVRPRSNIIGLIQGAWFSGWLSRNVSNSGTPTVFNAHPRSFLDILPLRTSAIYSGSKRVTISLSITYLVCRPWFSFIRPVRDSLFPQTMVVVQLIIYFHHRVVVCESLPGSSYQHYWYRGVRSVNPSPTSRFNACDVTRRDAKTIFNLSLFLAFELCQSKPSLYAPICSQDLATVIVILTVWRRFCNCMFRPPLTGSWSTTLL